MWKLFLYEMQYLSEIDELFHDGGRYHIEQINRLVPLYDNGLRRERVKISIKSSITQTFIYIILISMYFGDVLQG